MQAGLAFLSRQVAEHAQAQGLHTHTISSGTGGIARKVGLWAGVLSPFLLCELSTKCTLCPYQTTKPNHSKVLLSPATKIKLVPKLC